jgi:hypothetical protein
MKHWETMTALENEVHRVREFKTLLDVTTRGIENNGTVEEAMAVMYTLLGMIEDIDVKLYEQFHLLWDEVRRDSFESSDDSQAEVAEAGERWNQILSGLPEGTTTLSDGDGTIGSYRLDTQI